MKYIWTIWFLMIFLFPVSANAEEPPIQTAFVRGHSLFLLHGTEEILLHENKTYPNIDWSFDGQWLVYEACEEGKDGEIWLYHLPTANHIKIKLPGHSPMWNPNNHTFAFLSDSILSVVELSSMTPVIHQLTGGVSTFSWDANGTNLIASASAVLFPDGWSHPRLYEVHWDLEKKEQNLDVKVEPLHTIGSPLSYEDTEILSIDADHFTWTNDGKLLAFLVSPTSSWANDSNMISVFVKENKILIPLGEALPQKNWIKWAPTNPVLASIQGGGRLSQGVQNKTLTVQSIIPIQKKTFTPAGYADVDFDWLDDTKIIVARGKETKNNTEKFVSALHIVELKEKKAASFTAAPEGASDKSPHHLRGCKKIGWIREASSGRKDAWTSLLDGSEAKKIIENVEEVHWFKN